MGGWAFSTPDEPSAWGCVDASPGLWPSRLSPVAVFVPLPRPADPAFVSLFTCAGAESLRGDRPRGAVGAVSSEARPASRRAP